MAIHFLSEGLYASEGGSIINDDGRVKSVANATRLLRERIKTSVATVGHSTWPDWPQLLSTIRSNGSTKSGDVIASIPSVHACRPAERHSRTASRRSQAMSKGCTTKKAPHATAMPSDSSIIYANKACPILLTRKAKNMAEPALSFLNGLKQNRRRTSDAGKFQRRDHNSDTEEAR